MSNLCTEVHKWMQVWYMMAHFEQSSNSITKSVLKLLSLWTDFRSDVSTTTGFPVLIYIMRYKIFLSDDFIFRGNHCVHSKNNNDDWNADRVSSSLWWYNTGNVSFWITYYKLSQLDQSYTIVTAGYSGVDNITAFISVVTVLWIPGLCSESEQSKWDCLI